MILYKEMEQGSKVKIVCKQDEGQRSIEAIKRFKGYQRMKINSKAFAIPILTTIKSA